jgi:hypothetical protein
VNNLSASKSECIIVTRFDAQQIAYGLNEPVISTGKLRLAGRLVVAAGLALAAGLTEALGSGLAEVSVVKGC